MNRREFLEVFGSAALAAGSLAGLAGCFDLGRLGEPEPDIILSGGREDAGRIKAIYPKTREMARNSGQMVRVGLLGDRGEMRILDILRRQDSGDISVFDEKTGKLAVLGLGWKLISPSIKFMDEDGEILLDNDGNEMEYAFFGPNFNLAPAREKTDWFMLGVKAAAIGFAVWLGAEIFGLVLSAVSFIAYYVMILALVAAGIALLSRGAKWLFKQTKWDFAAVEDFFGKKTEEIRDFIGQVAAAF